MSGPPVSRRSSIQLHSSKNDITITKREAQIAGKLDAIAVRDTSRSGKGHNFSRKEVRWAREVLRLSSNSGLRSLGRNITANELPNLVAALRKAQHVFRKPAKACHWSWRDAATVCEDLSYSARILIGGTQRRGRTFTLHHSTLNFVGSVVDKKVDRDVDVEKKLRKFFSKKDKPNPDFAPRRSPKPGDIEKPVIRDHIPQWLRR